MTLATETPADRYVRYARAVGGEAYPVALVDLDALSANVAHLVGLAAARGKTVRVASKSVRSVELLRRIAELGGPAVRGVMAYCAAEASHLAANGVKDLLVAYPSASPRDAALVAEANRDGAVVRATVDAAAHLDVLAAAARKARVIVPVVVDVDVAYRPLGAYLGVRRSPLHDVPSVVALVRRVRATDGLSFAGLQAYEAHVAGLPDAAGLGVAGALSDAAKRAMKRAARAAVAETRQALATALAAEGVAVPLFNGGGTGSVASTADEPAVSEVAVGSGFLASHLFDGYEGLRLAPAACFALQVVREPAPGFVTCLGGGLIASGSAGVDRLPVPYLPAGLSLTPLEGAGEVQTPLVLPPGVHLAPGSPVFFRHAKAGELAEHVNAYLLVRGDRVEGRALTYRGEGKAFL
jgi:D-serine deaminase-like pyridoxal phosphate-dependent protein